MRNLRKIAIIMICVLTIGCLCSCDFIFATHPIFPRNTSNGKVFKVFELVTNSCVIDNEAALTKIIVETNSKTNKVIEGYSYCVDERAVYIYYISGFTSTENIYLFTQNAFLVTDKKLTEDELEQFKYENNWYNKEIVGETCMYDDLYSVRDNKIDNETDLPILTAEKMRQLGYLEVNQDWYFGEYTYCYPNKILYAIKENEYAESYKYLILIEFLGNGVIDIQSDKVFDIETHSLKEFSDFINENAIACWQGYTVGEDEIKSLVLD